MENINTTCHRILKSFMTNEMIALDATVGNGNDTAFLCKYCKKVYGFDIQEKAISNTLKRCESFSNLILFQENHANLSDFVHNELDIAIFNFGYLPHSDPSIITLPTTSLQALESCSKLLKKGGKLMLACYIGHQGGDIEHNAIKSWLESSNYYFVQTYTTPKENSPILYECTKM